jgi:hypothetical protein
MEWKLITAGTVLIVCCGAPMVVQRIQADAQAQAAQQRDNQDAAQLQLSKELSYSAPDVVWGLIKETAQYPGPENAVLVCMQFSAPAAVEFAISVTGTSDCIAAVQRWESEIINANAYVTDVNIPQSAWSTNGDAGWLNGCAVDWNPPQLFGDPTPAPDPGPRFGHMDLQRLDGHGWLIVGYRPC